MTPIPINTEIKIHVLYKQSEEEKYVASNVSYSVVFI